jgi:cell division protein FtsZ
MNILTIGVVTKPFSFEGKQRGEQAIEGINKLRASVDSLIVIPNDKIFNVIDKKTPIKKAFAMIDKILTLGVNGITNLIINPGLINVDYADIKNVMQNS